MCWNSNSPKIRSFVRRRSEYDLSKRPLLRLALMPLSVRQRFTVSVIVMRHMKSIPAKTRLRSAGNVDASFCFAMW